MKELRNASSPYSLTSWILNLRNPLHQLHRSVGISIGFWNDLSSFVHESDFIPPVYLFVW